MARGAVVAMVLAGALLVGGVAHADLKGLSDAYNARIASELEKIAPEAARAWRDAVAAGDRDDLAASEALYREVRLWAPRSSHALRRLCTLADHRQHRDEAIRLCREAVALEPIVENRVALAMCLSSPLAPGQPPPRRDLDEAMALAAAAAAGPDADVFAQLALCNIALQQGAEGPLRQCVPRLLADAPDEVATHVFAAILAGADGEWDRSFAEVARARQLGMPAANADELEARLRESRPILSRVLPIGLRAGAIWLALLAFLVVAGMALSAAAMRSARRLPSLPGGHVTGIDLLVRRLYRGLLWICCFYYYLSIPVVLLLVFVLCGGIVYGFLIVGHIPVQLLLVVVLVAVMTLVAVVRSLFVRSRDDDPGTRLDLATEPSLRALLDEVAARVGTRAVDNVYLTPGTDLAVTERGDSIWRQLRGARSERCLILGAGVLDGMTRAQLKSVLAHEYGHFQNRDTAGGGFALAVRRSLFTLAHHLARGGVARWYNPAWWFVSGFFKLFMRISQGASRLQEILCDRWAAFAYGSETFELGLSHVIAQGARFDATTDATLREVIEKRHPLTNLYQYVPEKPPSEAEITRVLNARVHEAPSPYASHPSPSERVGLVQALAAPGTALTDGDGAPAWEVFADRAAIERRMTEVIRERLAARHGVQLPSPPPDAPA